MTVKKRINITLAMLASLMANSIFGFMVAKLHYVGTNGWARDIAFMSAMLIIGILAMATAAREAQNVVLESLKRHVDAQNGG